jgi:hypothetical protein
LHEECHSKFSFVTLSDPFIDRKLAIADRDSNGTKNQGRFNE